MLKVLSAIAAAAVIAGAVTMIPGLAQNVEARAAQTSGKSDRLDAHPYGRACSQQAWPYFETACLRNITSPIRKAPAVRLVTTDRLQSTN
ncbi:MAG TPA: hypothetical protein VHA77_15495 [Xanthobacteraceae bacterium]|jgi:hypothetical protein|nr:hypothetical protein [Xanthobacteraceae bacterium]